MHTPKPLVAIIGTGAAAAMIFNILPVFIGKAQESLDLSIAQAGWIGSVYLSGFGLASVAASFLLHRVDRRLSTWFAFLLAATLLLATSFIATRTIEGYGTIAALLFATGLALGTLYCVSFVLANEFKDATRAVGIKLGGEVLLGAVLIFVLPVVVYPAFGFAGMLAALAIILLCLSLSAAGIAKTSSTAENRPNERNLVPIRAALALFALFIFTISQAALWSFAELGGIDKGMDNALLGSILSLAVLLGGVGAFLAALVSDKMGKRMPAGMAAVVYLLAMCLFLFGDGRLAYALAVNLFFLVWLFTLPYFISAIGEADATGRAVTLVTACLAFGSMLGPVTGAYLINMGGYETLYALGTVFSLSAFALLLRLRSN